MRRATAAQVTERLSKHLPELLRTADACAVRQQAIEDELVRRPSLGTRPPPRVARLTHRAARLTALPLPVGEQALTR